MGAAPRRRPRHRPHRRTSRPHGTASTRCRRGRRRRRSGPRTSTCGAGGRPAHRGGCNTGIGTLTGIDDLAGLRRTGRRCLWPAQVTVSGGSPADVRLALPDVASVGPLRRKAPVHPARLLGHRGRRHSRRSRSPAQVDRDGMSGAVVTRRVPEARSRVFASSSRSMPGPRGPLPTQRWADRVDPGALPQRHHPLGRQQPRPAEGRLASHASAAAALMNWPRQPAAPRRGHATTVAAGYRSRQRCEAQRGRGGGIVLKHPELTSRDMPPLRRGPRCAAKSVSVAPRGLALLGFGWSWSATTAWRSWSATTRTTNTAVGSGCRRCRRHEVRRELHTDERGPVTVASVRTAGVRHVLRRHDGGDVHCGQVLVDRE